MKFNTKFERVRIIQEEKEPSVSRLDVSGYVPKEKRIRAIIEAGERLERFRRGEYDSTGETEPDIEKMSVDPTRSKSFGKLEAAQALHDVRSRGSARTAQKKLEEEVDRKIMGEPPKEEVKEGLEQPAKGSETVPEGQSEA